MTAVITADCREKNTESINASSRHKKRGGAGSSGTSALGAIIIGPAWRQLHTTGPATEHAHWHTHTHSHTHHNASLPVLKKKKKSPSTGIGSGVTSTHYKATQSLWSVEHARKKYYRDLWRFNGSWDGGSFDMGMTGSTLIWLKRVFAASNNFADLQVGHLHWNT